MTAYPRAGRLRDKVTVRVRNSTKDEYGGPANTFDDGETRRCDIQPLNGKEFFASQAEHNDISVRVRFRYSNTMAAQLKTGNQLENRRTSPYTVYDIESVINHGNFNRELICMCKVHS